MEEEKLKSKLDDHIFLLLLKAIPHTVSIVYILLTILWFCNVDLISLGYFFHLSWIPWIYFILSSYRFKFCYVHRLPLYYIAINEILSTLDVYIGIPISSFNLMLVHLALIGILILGYTKYYEKSFN